jgi:hypothetical protein
VDQFSGFVRRDCSACLTKPATSTNHDAQLENRRREFVMWEESEEELEVMASFCSKPMNGMS